MIDEKSIEIESLGSEIAELKSESEGTDITTIRGLAYEYLFEAVVLGEKFDHEAKIDGIIEQYKLDEFEQAEFLTMIDVLIARYELED